MKSKINKIIVLCLIANVYAFSSSSNKRHLDQSYQENNPRKKAKYEVDANQQEKKLLEKAISHAVSTGITILWNSRFQKKLVKVILEEYRGILNIIAPKGICAINFGAKIPEKIINDEDFIAYVHKSKIFLSLKRSKEHRTLIFRDFSEPKNPKIVNNMNIPINENEFILKCMPSDDCILFISHDNNTYRRVFLLDNRIPDTPLLDFKEKYLYHSHAHYITDTKAQISSKGNLIVLFKPSNRINIAKPILSNSIDSEPKLNAVMPTPYTISFYEIYKSDAINQLENLKIKLLREFIIDLGDPNFTISSDGTKVFIEDFPKLLYCDKSKNFNPEIIAFLSEGYYDIKLSSDNKELLFERVKNETSGTIGKDTLFFKTDDLCKGINLKPYKQLDTLVMHNDDKGLFVSEDYTKEYVYMLKNYDSPNHLCVFDLINHHEKIIVDSDLKFIITDGAGFVIYYIEDADILKKLNFEQLIYTIRLATGKISGEDFKSVFCNMNSNFINHIQSFISTRSTRKFLTS